MALEISASFYGKFPNVRSCIYVGFRLTTGVFASTSVRSRSIVARFNVPGYRKMFSINSWQFVTFSFLIIVRKSGANVAISSFSRISSLCCNSSVKLTRNKICKTRTNTISFFLNFKMSLQRLITYFAALQKEAIPNT